MCFFDEKEEVILEILRGNLYYADLEPVIGSEQGGIRPVLVIQNNIANTYSPTVIIAPTTSKVDKKPNLPTHVEVKAFQGLKYDSIILLEQIRVIDKQRLKSYLGRLAIKDMELIDIGIIHTFGLKVKLEDRKI